MKHASINQYKCRVCGFVTKYKGVLEKRHNDNCVAFVERELRDYKHQCNVCKQWFKHRSTIERSHNEKCTVPAAQAAKSARQSKELMQRRDSVRTIRYVDYVVQLKLAQRKDKSEPLQFKPVRGAKRNGAPLEGKVWIYSPEERRATPVPKEELETWLAKGWIRGRKNRI
jgi:hypothetical protein